jgi:hypothetical protein
MTLTQWPTASRHTVPKPAQAYEPEVPVNVREWIGPALASPDVVLGTQPPAQPHSCVVVERAVRFVDGAYLEVVRPSAQRARAWESCSRLRLTGLTGRDTVSAVLTPIVLEPLAKAGGSFAFQAFRDSTRQPYD